MKCWRVSNAAWDLVGSLRFNGFKMALRLVMDTGSAGTKLSLDLTRTFYEEGSPIRSLTRYACFLEGWDRTGRRGAGNSSLWQFHTTSHLLVTALKVHGRRSMVKVKDLECVTRKEFGSQEKIKLRCAGASTTYSWPISPKMFLATEEVFIPCYLCLGLRLGVIFFNHRD